MCGHQKSLITKVLIEGMKSLKKKKKEVNVTFFQFGLV